MVDYKNIELPCLHKYFAGTDGSIYKLRQEGMMQLTARFPKETHRIKYVHLLFHCSNSDHNFNIQLPVAYLVCGAYNGFYKGFHDAGYRDGDPENTKPENLFWQFDDTSDRKMSLLRSGLEKINEHYLKERLQKDKGAL